MKDARKCSYCHVYKETSEYASRTIMQCIKCSERRREQRRVKKAKVLTMTNGTQARFCSDCGIHRPESEFGAEQEYLTCVRCRRPKHYPLGPGAQPRQAVYVNYVQWPHFAPMVVGYAPLPMNAAPVGHMDESKVKQMSGTQTAAPPPFYPTRKRKQPDGEPYTEPQIVDRDSIQRRERDFGSEQGEMDAFPMITREGLPHPMMHPYQMMSVGPTGEVYNQGMMGPTHTSWPPQASWAHEPYQAGFLSVDTHYPHVPVPQDFVSRTR